MKTKILASLAILTLALMGAGRVRAQDSDQPSDDQNGQTTAQQNGQPNQSDANAPGVARVSLIHGQVSTQRGDTGDWSAAAINQPLEAGDKISTGDNSQAEIQLDYANVLRLGNNAQVNIVSLGNSQIQIQVAQGLVNFSTFEQEDSNAEIDTPNVAVRPGRGTGSFRILVSPDGESQVIVREGEADVSTPQGSTHVTKGQLITIQGSGDDVQYKITDAPGKDDFDKWNEKRDHAIESAQSWQHTDQYYTGTQDLDQYGTWSEVPDYGNVWVPDVDSGWAPYREGRWLWEPYWGWTWVSYEPWGWAPYHYGRWFEYRDRWCWWPGPVFGGYYRPFWSPAYVSFFGFGDDFGFSAGFGFGSIGWLPIGPGDYFFPWWGAYRGRFGYRDFGDRRGFDGRGGWRPLREGSFSNIHEFQTNERFRGSMSTLRSERFGAAGVRPEAASRQMVRGGGKFMTGNVPVTPSRQNLSASGHAANRSTISNRANGQHFYSTNHASAPTRSFDRESSGVRQSIQQNGRAGGSSGGTNGNSGRQGGAYDRPNGSGGENRGPSSGGNSTDRGNGWHRFSPPSGGSSGSPENNRPYPGNSNGGNHGNPGSGNPGSPSSGASNYRPPLNMRQPVFNRPNSGSSGGNYRPPSNNNNNGGGYNRGGSSGNGGYRPPSNNNSGGGGGYNRGGGGGGGGGNYNRGGGGGGGGGGGYNRGGSSGNGGYRPPSNNNSGGGGGNYNRGGGGGGGGGGGYNRGGGGGGGGNHGGGGGGGGGGHSSGGGGGGGGGHRH